MPASDSTRQFVSLCEVGPRDGFQYEDRPIPTDRKVDIIEALADAGLPRIQVASFVHPKWAPQMADAEDVVARLNVAREVKGRRQEAADSRSGRNSETIYSGLALNMRGLERLMETDLPQADLSIATNEQHGRDNANMSVDEGRQAAAAMIETALEDGVAVQLGFQTVFGYDKPGDTSLALVVEMAQQFADYQLESLSLADTTGLANPRTIRTYVQAVQNVIGDTPLVLHLHDTRGLGMANVTEALNCGVRRFDTALGGMGGCPFIPGATGNIATEDTVYLLSSLGYETGVLLEEVGARSREMEAFLQKEFSGKMHRLMAE